MEARLPVLENVRVASPCTASWEQMKGDEKTRFCGQCKLNVHNFSAMTEAEIIGLIQNAKGRVCGRFFRRADGTMITSDCPVGLAALRRKVVRGVSRVAAAVISAVGIFASLRCSSARESVAAAPATPATPVMPATPVTSVTDVEPIKSICEWLTPAPAKATMWMGDIIVAPRGAGGSQGNGAGR